MNDSNQRRSKLKSDIQQLISASDDLTMTEAIEVLSGLINMGMRNMLNAPGEDKKAKEELK